MDWSVRALATGAVCEIGNPAAPEELASLVRTNTPTDLEAVLQVARDAQSIWQRLPTAERIQHIQAFLDDLVEAEDEIAFSITVEQGKPLAEGKAETLKSIAEARAMCCHALSTGAQESPSARPGIRNTILHRPRGVIAALTPWNFPILTPMRKIAPALVFGNAIILKPSEFTPSAALIAERIARPHLPEGLFQVIVGEGDLGSALSGSSVDGVTFTGSVSVGKKVAAMAARSLAEISLELGGKNAAVVNDSNDLEFVADAIVSAAMQCAGQRCTAISRVIVQQDLEEPLVGCLADRLNSLPVGDGFDPQVRIGAITTESQYQRIQALVESGVQAGAEVVVGGCPAHVETRPNGRFFKPTLFRRAHPDMEIAKEEIFGPVLTVLPYKHFEESLEIVNGLRYGLTSALFSNRNDLINRFVDRVHSGMIHINHGTIPDSHMPFGGIGESGVGAYSVGLSARSFYTTEHAVYNRYE